MFYRCVEITGTCRRLTGGVVGDGARPAPTIPAWLGCFTHFEIRAAVCIDGGLLSLSKWGTAPVRDKLRSTWLARRAWRFGRISEYNPLTSNRDRVNMNMKRVRLGGATLNAVHGGDDHGQRRRFDPGYRTGRCA
jgi:hypothetical protein